MEPCPFLIWMGTGRPVGISQSGRRHAPLKPNRKTLRVRQAAELTVATKAINMVERARRTRSCFHWGKRCKWPNTLSCGLARKGRYDRNTGGRESTITKRSGGSAVGGGAGRGQGAG